MKLLLLLDLTLSFEMCFRDVVAFLQAIIDFIKLKNDLLQKRFFSHCDYRFWFRAKR